jgi:hypothetical protein
MQRSFALPLAFTFLYFSLGRRGLGNTAGMAASCFLAALVYPVMFLITSGAWLLGFVRLGWPVLDLSRPRALGVCVLTVVLGITTVLVSKADVPGRGTLGHYMSWTEIRETPHFQHGGARELFKDDIPQSHGFLPFDPDRVYRRLFANPFNHAGGMLAGLIALTSLAAWRSPRPPREVWRYFASGNMLYALAVALALMLFYPGRYMPLTWLPFFVCLLGCGAATAAERWQRRGLPPMGCCLVLVAVMAIIGVAAGYATTKDVNRSLENPETARLMTFLAGLPQGSLMAGPPKLMQLVPLTARQPVYLHQGILDLREGDEDQRRFENLTRIVFAQDPGTVRKTLRQEEIAYLVLDTRHLQPGNAAAFLSVHPYRDTIRAMAASGHAFALANPPGESVVFRAGNYVVLDAHKL